MNITAHARNISIKAREYHSPSQEYQIWSQEYHSSSKYYDCQNFTVQARNITTEIRNITAEIRNITAQARSSHPWPGPHHTAWTVTQPGQTELQLQPQLLIRTSGAAIATATPRNYRCYYGFNKELQIHLQLQLSIVVQHLLSIEESHVLGSEDWGWHTFLSQLVVLPWSRSDKK